MTDKTENAYKSISEVALLLNLVNKKNGKPSTHTIRFWEKEFKQIKPKILTGKRRYYDKKTINILKKIKYLLKDKGFTINGVKKMLNNVDGKKLDLFANESISSNINIKNKLNKISKLLKELKKIK